MDTPALLFLWLLWVTLDIRKKDKGREKIRPIEIMREERSKTYCISSIISIASFYYYIFQKKAKRRKDLLKENTIPVQNLHNALSFFSPQQLPVMPNAFSSAKHVDVIGTMIKWWVGYTQGE